MITESLTRLVVNDKNIIGIAIRDMIHKISQYADDSTLICRNEADVRA